MAGPTRQHYAYATGGALQAADTAKKVIKFAKGGKVSAYKTPTNASGKKVGTTDRFSSAAPRSAPKGKSASTATRGDDKFTSVTQSAKHLAKGFKLQRP